MIGPQSGCPWLDGKSGQAQSPAPGRNQSIPGTHCLRPRFPARGRLGIQLSPRQYEGVEMVFRHNLSIITGGPGTGKSTILKAVIEAYQRLYPKNIIKLGAPTGKASRRMAETTGMDSAQTAINQFPEHTACAHAFQLVSITYQQHFCPRPAAVWRKPPEWTVPRPCTASWASTVRTPDGRRSRSWKLTS